MSSERFRATAPEQLADDLTRFVYLRDRQFANNETDVSRHMAERELRVEVGDESGDLLALTDTERITVTAFRNFYIQGKHTPRPSDFIVAHRKITQLDTLPDQLRHVLPAELIEQYDNTEPGDLNEVRKIEYGITVEPDGEVGIGRDISYRLRDIKKVLYKVREAKLPKTEKVHVASEGTSLQVRSTQFPEAIDDPFIWVQLSEEFDTLADTHVLELEQHWLDEERTVLIACVNALMNSLVTGRPVKDVV